jgi:hypothetical protein
MTRPDHPDVAKAEARGDYRNRCLTCGGLVCQACGACNGAHDPESAFTNANRLSGYGRITTDNNGRTLHKECRYVENLF